MQLSACLSVLMGPVSPCLINKLYKDMGDVCLLTAVETNFYLLLFYFGAAVSAVASLHRARVTAWVLPR